MTVPEPAFNLTRMTETRLNDLRSRHFSPVLALNAALLLLPVLGCASVRASSKPPAAAPGPFEAPAAQAPPSTSSDSFTPSRETTVQATLDAADAEYSAGIAALRSGAREEARGHFDRAVTVLLDGPVAIQDDPRLAESWGEMLDAIHALELEALDADASAEAAESLVEELDKEEPTVSPEAAARERALVEGAAERFDVPVVLNTQVLAWIEAYSGKSRARFEPGLVRSGAYLDMMRRILREEGVPEDLVYMAQVESAFKSHAYSRAKAKGYWQFIQGTAKRYGLRRDYWVDERSDPEESTRAAAAYLRDLYEMFGDWYLAMAAYNAGEGKIQRAINRTGKTDFWALAKTRELRLETKNYVPAILATMVISKSPEQFGLTTEKDPPLAYDAVMLEDPIDLRVAARCAGTTLQEIQRLNPALYRLQTPPDGGTYPLRLPTGTREAFEIVAASLPDAERVPVTRHTVRRGETLATVAKKYGVSTTSLAGANGLSSKSRLKAGATLTVPSSLAPLSGAHPDRPGSTETARSGRSTSKGKSGVHTVVRGDTLYSIARRYGTTVDALRTANGLDANDPIKVGQRLQLHKAAPQQAASKPGAGTTGGGGSAFPYTVRKGDTLARIAMAHGTSVDSICRWNGLSRNAILRVGTRLTLYR